MWVYHYIRNYPLYCEGEILLRLKKTEHTLLPMHARELIPQTWRANLHQRLENHSLILENFKETDAPKKKREKCLTLEEILHQAANLDSVYYSLVLLHPMLYKRKKKK